MKLAVMQPYFFPYLGYFQLIHSVDRFVFFDDVQYVRKSWMSRNRLLNISSNTPFFIRPSLVKPSYKAMLGTVELDDNYNWKKNLLCQVKAYKNKAPFYSEIIPLIKNILSNDHKLLLDFNVNSIIEIANWLGLNVKFERFSNFQWSYKENLGKGDWAPEVSKKLKATYYINSPGGESFISTKPFNENGIKLGFLQPHLLPYDQKTEIFTPGLSIIDVLFFNGKKGTLDLLDQYEIKWKN